MFLSLVTLLCRLHESGVPHRAFNPSNILINNENKVKLVFFKNPELLQFLSLSDHEMYKSPEGLRSKCSESPSPTDFFAEDIWALGKTMYEIYTLSPQQDFSKFIIAGSEEEFFTHIFRTLPNKLPELESLLLKLLQFAPTARPKIDKVRELLEQQVADYQRYSWDTVTKSYMAFDDSATTPILQPEPTESELTKTYSEVISDYLLASLPLLSRSL